MVKPALALGAMLLSGAALAAPESLVKVNTYKGEVLLEVLATGTSTTKIIKVSTYCDLRVNAAGKDEAAKALTKAEQSLSNGLRAVGLDAAVLDFSLPTTMNVDQGFAASEVAAYAADAAAALSDAATDAVESLANAKTMVILTRRVGISTASVIDMQAARAVFSESGCEEDYRMIRQPNVELAQPAAAKAKATTAAIAAAKAQAENYASALNMRVVRMLRVSETGAIREFLGSESDFILQEMRNDRDRRAPITDDVPISASISVDFVLGPKS